MLNKYVTLIVLLFLTTISYAGSNEIVLPLQFNSGNPAPYGMASTTVTINGKKIPLLFDLGASKEYIVLRPAALKKLKVHFTGKKTCSNTLTGKICLPNFVINQLELEGSYFYNLPGQSAKSIWGGGVPKENAGAFKYGLMGMKFLSQFNLLIDYSHHKLILIKNNENPIGYHLGKWITIPFVLDGGIMTEAKINNYSAKLIWDTGAVPSIIRSSDTFGSTPKQCSKKLPYEKNNCILIKTKTFSVAGKALPNTWFMLENLPKNIPFSGLVGDNFFRNNIVFINFKNKTLAIYNVDTN
jgi:predicted aspartyl protease